MYFATKHYTQVVFIHRYVHIVFLNFFKTNNIILEFLKFESMELELH